MIAVDGRDEFLFRTRAAEPDKPPEDTAVADAMRRCVGVDVAIEIVAHEPWTAGMALVAERFADRRVFLAGDAVHLFTPTGGFGMNTGIDDAVNLSWKLAASLQGWGGNGLLESYEIERMPIASRNTEAARQLTANIGETDVRSGDRTGYAGRRDGPARGRKNAGEFWRAICVDRRATRRAL